MFIFEKRTAEKLHKPKRKEAVTELLRNSVKNLERFRHPKVFIITYSIIVFYFISVLIVILNNCSKY